MTKYFILYPIFERIHDHFQVISLLPDPSVIHHYDAYGNLLLSSRDILEEDLSCSFVQNYTESFKEFIDNLGVEHPASFTRFEFEPASISQVFMNLEDSSEYWETFYLKRFDFFNDETISLQMLPKTFKTFPLIDVPLRKRYAIILETYMIDLIKSFYPFIEGAKISNFEDLLGILLFHLYFHLDTAAEGCLYRIYLSEVLKDIKSMGTVLRLPDPESYLSKNDAFKTLLSDTLKFNLFFTFNLFQFTVFLENIIHISPSNLIKMVINSKLEGLIKLHLSRCDRNCVIDNIATDYSGKLCHLVYWSDHINWLFLEFLKYKDVNWDEPDCRGYTVLGYMVHDHSLDERYKQFLKRTKMFVTCFKDESIGIERNIIDECLTVPDQRRGLSKLVTYLEERHKSDDFSTLLVSAAIHHRMDYFNRLLDYRKSNCCHELDASFQLIFQHMRLDEPPVLYKYLVRIVMNLKDWHGEKGYRLEHIFFVKWEHQLAKWRAAADEVGLIS